MLESTIAGMRRVVRLSLAVAVVSASWLAATTASAQFVDVDLVCTDPNSVFTNFADEGKWADFSDVSNCNKICKSFVNKCKAFSKNWHACTKKAIGDDAELERKAFCDPLTDKEDKKACKTEVKEEEQADKDDAKSDREELLGLCEEIEPDCVSVCTTPIT